MILHVDIDAFYASVEELDNPNLKGKPVVVGGRSRRGVITTANYEARKFGLHSAMPIFMARSLCPQVIIVPGRMYRYKEKSIEVFSILKTYAKVIEQVSIDEAYLDITGTKDGRELAMKIKSEVKEKTGLTISVGLSYNKFLAKIASDWNKPDGFMEIDEDMVPEILYDLDISKVHGIGKVSEDRLRELGINNVKDLMSLSREYMTLEFNKMGHELYDRIRGIDRREVKGDRKRKSIGVERTFTPTGDEKILYEYIDRFSKELSEDLKRIDKSAMTITIKIKTDKFKIHTISKTLLESVEKYEDIKNIAEELYEKLGNRERLRLLGITASSLVDRKKIQLNFWENKY